MRNLKLAFRTLFKSPFVATVAVLSLALGIGANGNYEVTDLVHGDTVTEVLNYVQFRATDLLQTFRRKVGAAKHLSRQEANTFIADYVAGLEGYTYLEGDAAQ